MFAMFKQLFLGFTAFFIAFEKIGKSTVSLSEWAEETAAAFADEARIERSKKLATLKAELKVIESKQPKAV